MMRKPALAPSNTSSDELLNRCLNGDRFAQIEFYRKYKEYVTCTIYKVLCTTHELDDVTQDAFLEIFRNLHRFQGRSKLSTWIYRISINVALQKIRRNKNQLPVSNAFWKMPQNEETPQKRLEMQEDMVKANLVLEMISRKKRTVFLLHEVLGFRSTEIAEMLNVNVMTIRTRLHYARKEFRRILTEMEPLVA